MTKFIPLCCLTDISSR